MLLKILFYGSVLLMSLFGVGGLKASVPEGFLDVTAEPYFADHTGATDTTAALQTAILDAIQNNQVLWLPGGTYRISQRLVAHQLDNVGQFNLVMMGSTVNPQNRATIVLAPNSVGFTDANARRAMIHFYNDGTVDAETVNTNLYNQGLIGVDFKVLAGNTGAVGVRMQGAEGCTIQDVNVDLTEGGHTGIWGVPGSGGSTHRVSVTGGVIGIDTRRADNLGAGGSQPTVVITGSTFTHQSGPAVFAATRGAMVLIGNRILRDIPGPAIRLRKHWVGQPFDGSLHLVDSTVEYTGYDASNTVIEMDAVGFGRSFHFENSYVLNGHQVYAASAPANTAGWRHFHRLAVHDQPSARNPGFSWQPKEPVFIDGVDAGNDFSDFTDEAPPADLQARHQWHDDFPTWEHPGVVNVKTLGAQGDGITDDWAILQAAINDHEVVFFPKGTYQVSKTLDLRPDSKLIGSFHTFTRIRAISTLSNRFAGTTEAQGDQPIVRTADTAEADTVIAFLGIRRLYPLAQHNPTPGGNYALEWRCAGTSLLRHVEFESRANTNVRPDLVAQNYYGYDLAVTPINPNHPQLDFQTGHWAWPGSEPTVQVRGNGGGRWFNFTVHGRQALRSHVPFIRVEGTSQPINFYHFHIQQQDSINHSEFINASNVSIYGSKAEIKGTFAYFQGCNNVRLIGHGGMSTPDPDVNPPFLFRFIDSDNFIIAGIGDTVNEGTTQWIGGAFDRWVHTHIRDWNPILDQHPGRAEVQVPWDTRPIVYVRGNPQPEAVSGGIGSGVVIHAPKDGSTHIQDTTVWFFGTAQTFEEGNFSHLGSWSSSIDGPLGTGASVSTSTLSLGLHTITFTAVSPQGQALSRSITLSVVTAPPSEQTVIIENEPVADAHVRGDNTPMKRRNYGSLPEIETRSTGPGPGYLRFSLSGLPTEINTAKLVFTTSHTDAGTLNIVQVSDTSWTEGGVNWNNRPTLGSALGSMSFSGTTGQEYELDVTAYTMNQIASGRVNFGTSTEASLLRFSSREGTAPPRLEIQYTQTTPLNNPPVVEILTPAASMTYEKGQAISFTGSANDNEDGDLSASLFWYSSRDGILGSGAALSVDTLSVGDHVITLHVTDQGGTSAADTLTLTVSPALPSILEQPQNALVSVGGSATLTVSAAGEPLTYQWYQGIAGATTSPISGANEAVYTTPALFADTSYWVRVSNETGHVDSTAATVTVNDPPVVEITSPESLSGFLVGTVITFSASATDTEDGDLSSAILWTSSLDGYFGSGASLQIGTLNVGDHEITATVTDSGGRSSSATLTLTIFSDTIFYQPFESASTVAPYVGSADHLFDYIGTVGSVNNRATLSIDQQALRVDIAYTDDENTSQLSATRLTRTTDLPIQEDFAVVSVSVKMALNAWPAAPANYTLFNMVLGQNFRTGAFNPVGGTGNGPAFTSFNLQAVGGATNTFRTTREAGSTATDAEFTIVPVNGVYVVDLVLAANSGDSFENFGSPSGVHTLQPNAVSIWVNGVLHVNNATDGLDPAARIHDFSFGFGSGAEQGYDTGSSWDGSYWLDEVKIASVSDFSPPEFNHTPEVAITAPADNTTVTEGDSVTFSGTATDVEDDDATLLASATWTSSLDGALGIGASLATSALTVGTHTITFTATDSGGLSDSAQITLTVEAVPLPTYTVTFLAGEGGSLTGSTSQDVMEGGSTTDVSALANEGYAFVNWTWTGSNTSTANPLSIANVTADLTVTAHFEEVVPPPPSTAIFDQDFSTSADVADYIGTADHRFDFLDTVGNAQDRASLSVVDGRMRNTIAYTDDGVINQLSAARLTRLTDLPFEENFGVVSSRVILAPDSWDTTNVVYYAFNIGQNYRSGIYNPGTGTGRPHFATLSIQGLDTANTFRTIGAGGNSSNFTVTPENGRYVIDVVVAANAGISSQSFPSPTGDHTVLAGHVSIWINGSLHINNTTTGVTASEAIKHISFSTGSGTETDYAGGVKWNGYYEIDYVRAQTLSNFTGSDEDAYTEWAATNNIIGSPTDLTDGVPNLLRYALGGDATTPASAFRLEPVANPTGMTLSFTRIDDPKLTYEVWATDNLLDWGDTSYWIGQGSGPGVVEVPALGSQLYLHLRVRRE